MSRPLYLMLILLFVQSAIYSQTSKTIIVLDFEYKYQGAPLAGKDFASWIPAQIQTALVKSPYVTVVERNKLNEVLKEQALSQTGVIDEATAIKVGKIIGAQKILMGDYQCNLKERYSISARLVDIESGAVEVQRIASDLKNKEILEYAEDVAAHIIARMKNQIALENIAKLENPGEPFNINVSAEKDTFALGEMLTFTAESDKNCHLYIFDVGTSGKIHLLFPNKMQPKNFVKAGEKIRIENIRVSPPTGTEIVKAIATLDSVSYGHLLESAGTQATFQSLGDDLDRFSRDLEVMVSPLANDRWSSDTIQLEIISGTSRRLIAPPPATGRVKLKMTP